MHYKKTEIIENLLSLPFPETISKHFEITEIKEGKDRFDIRLEELKELVPVELSNCEGPIVLDGFCNSIELQTFLLKKKAVFLQVFRRRWKCSGETRHYSNGYDLHPEGVKATHEFAEFLKNKVGLTPEQHYDHIRSLWSRIP